jgi:hypothetical protein
MYFISSRAGRPSSELTIAIAAPALMSLPRISGRKNPANVAITPEQADVIGYPDRRRGPWGAYDNSRLRALGWSPTPLADAFAEYVDWLRQNPC